MKKNILSILSIYISLFISSCSSGITNLQVCNFNADGFRINKETMTNMDQDICITANLWDFKGSNAFLISNNTEEDITIHLDHSFIIINGKAYDLESSQNNVIPSRSYKQFQIENKISDIIWLEGKQMAVSSGSKTINFTKNTTPITYRIRIQYAAHSGTTKTKDCEMWVSSITNYAPKDIIQKISNKYNPQKYFDINPKPNQIYNYYQYSAPYTEKMNQNNIHLISTRKKRKEK